MQPQIAEKPLSPSIVRKAVLESGITKAEIAARAKVSKNIMKSLEAPDWSPMWSTMTQLMQAIEDIQRERARARR